MHFTLNVPVAITDPIEQRRVFDLITADPSSEYTNSLHTQSLTLRTTTEILGIDWRWGDELTFENTELFYHQRVVPVRI